MSGSIAFSQIPTAWRVPLFWVEFDPSRAVAGQPNKRTLFVGQALTDTAGGLEWAASPEQAAGRYGAGSPLAAMVAAYFLNDPGGEVWCLPIADAGGASAAVGELTFTGPASAAGVLSIYVAGKLVSVPVTSGETATAIATAVSTAINAAYGLPVTAAPALGVVTLTARNGGTVGNQITLATNYLGARAGEATPAGVTCTVTAMSGGATDPDLTGLPTTLGSEPFHFIVHHFANTAGMSAFGALMNETAGRWSYLLQLFGHAFTAKQDTSGNLVTYGDTLNDAHNSTFGYEAANATPAYIWAAANVGAIAGSIRNEPSRPVQTLAVLGVLATPTGSRFTKTEQNTLLKNGIALAGSSNYDVRVVRAVTHNRLNSFGQPTQAELDVETLYTSQEITERLRAMVTTKFARARLADDGTAFGVGLAAITPAICKAEIAAEYQGMQTDGLVEDSAAMLAATIVERDAADRSRLNVLWAPNLISGLRIFAAVNQFRL